MSIEIKHRTTGAVIRVVDANCLRGADLRGANLRGANLRGADLRSANLNGANLNGANLRDAYLSCANLRDADLRSAYLSCADLCDADLRDADLNGANLRDADLRVANLNGANLRDADLNGAKGITAPVIPNLDAAILDAIEAGGTLNMGSWHTCKTTHCRAGWAIHLAGAAGQALEDRIGPSAAGALIYHASTGRVPDFVASNEEALADIRACAAKARGQGAGQKP